MDREEIISGLKFTIEMFLFDPSTGETITESRNDMDKTIIDACKGAIELLEQQPCEDAISRSEAIRIASGYCHWTNIPTELAKLPSVNPKPCEDVISRQDAIDAIDSMIRRKFGIGCNLGEITLSELPSVSTEKTGRWIIVDDCEKFIAKSSECGCIEDSRMINKYPYCHCGAKMGVEE